MSYLILAGLSIIITVLWIKGKLYKLWKAGAIGVGIMFIVDSLGAKLNLYSYPAGILYLGAIPLFHIIYIFFISIIFINWIPRNWSKRFLYIIYISVLFLGIEAVMYSIGAISYQNWKITYSYILTVSGLTLLVYLYDLEARKTLT